MRPSLGTITEFVTVIQAQLLTGPNRAAASQYKKGE